MKKLDLETIESMTSTKFIDTDGWLQKQPF